MDIYIIWLMDIFGANPSAARQLLKHFTPRWIFENPEELRGFRLGFESEGLWERLAASANQRYLEGLYERCRDILENTGENTNSVGNDTRFVAYNNFAYPRRLKTIPQAPLGIFVKGNLPDDDIPAISIVGTRNCSNYGIRVARKISKELSEVGFNIISGLAHGIDSCAHQGALEATGYTSAVLGCSVDICYPADNFDLYRQILEKGGGLISEFLPKTRPSRWSFPVRNRIISALGDCLVVVEAGIKSGISHTVDHALAQGRDVFAVPGSILSKESEGTNELIKSGAVPVTSYLDIIYHLSRKKEFIKFFAKPHKEKTETSFEQKNVIKKENDLINKNLAPNENMVYACISGEAVMIDYISEKTQLNIEEILKILTILELEGLIKQLPAQRYIRH